MTTINFAGREIPIYGLVAIIGVLIGMGIGMLRAPRFGLSRDDAAYIFVFSGLFTVAGAKILYLLTAIPQMFTDYNMLISSYSSVEALKIMVISYFRGGLVFYGGAIGAFFGVIVTAKWYKKNLMSCYDALTPVFPLAHAFGRIGCTITGCCYGNATSSFFAITYHHSDFAPNDVSLIPVQPIESAAEFIIFIILMIYTHKKAAGKKSPSVSAERTAFSLFSLSSLSAFRTPALYIIMYAPVRFILEFFRGDELRGFIFCFSTSQFISLLVFFPALFCLIYSFKDTHSKKSV